jgi:hypothetical protein
MGLTWRAIPPFVVAMRTDGFHIVHDPRLPPGRSTVFLGTLDACVLMAQALADLSGLARDAATDVDARARKVSETRRLDRKVGIGPTVDGVELGRALDVVEGRRAMTWAELKLPGEPPR